MPRDAIESTARIWRRDPTTESVAPARRGTLLEDGSPYDAGSAMLFASELNHLMSECAPRQLVNDSGVGSVVVGGGDWSGYGGVNDWSGLNEPTPGDRTYGEQVIAWSRSTARCYGPFPAVIDRIGDGGMLAPRSVRCAVRAYGNGAANTLVLIAATATRRPPSDGYLAARTDTILAAAEETLFGTEALDLTWSSLPAQPRPEPTDTTGSGGVPGVVQVPEFYLWLGYLSTSATPMYITTVSFWELPPT
jgi:hypothetical protein